MGSVLDDLPGGSFTALLNDGEATANALGAGADLGAAAAAARLLSQPQPSQQVPWQPGEGEEDDGGDGGAHTWPSAPASLHEVPAGLPARAPNLLRPPASAHSAAGRRRRTGRRGEARAVRALTRHDVAVLKTRGLLAPYLLTWPAMGPQVTEQS